MVRAVVAVVGLGIVAMLFLAGVQAGLQNAGYERTQVNETFQPANATNVTSLNFSNLDSAYYDRNITVYDENDTLMRHGQDYDWIRENGTVRTLSGGGLVNDTNATVSYSWQQTTAEQRDMAAMLGDIPQAVGVIAPALILLLIFLVLT